MASLTASLLDSFVGKSIEDICPLSFGKKKDTHNHCAHFVGHVLKLNSLVVSGMTCAGMVFAGKKNPAAGALIRVNDIFNVSADLAEPDSKGCLAYYTLASNIGKDGLMGTMAQKHVGICLDGNVYNYGNTDDKVRKDKVGDLKALYGKNTITLYTVLPPSHDVLTLAQIKALATTK
jgi:hypothetical protein